MIPPRSRYPNLEINIFHIRNSIISDSFDFHFYIFLSISARNKGKRTVTSKVRYHILIPLLIPLLPVWSSGPIFWIFLTKKFRFKQFPDIF